MAGAKSCSRAVPILNPFLEFNKVMTITRVGSNEKYASGWDLAFGGKKKAAKSAKKAAKKKAVKKPAKKAAAASKAKKKPAKKKK